ncbi:MAG: HAD family hydrolase [Candidatus Melainabacteria bacterium]|nr:HAD family hydrolase [Candidatus Melainabacteria bacterium]
MIDTSGCITHHKLEDALRAMVREGLVLEDFDAAVEQLRRLDKTAESARSSVAEFVEILGIDKRYYEIGVKEIYENIPSELPIFPLEGALELLAELGQQHQVALVTAGIPSVQMDKLKKAGIDSRIFSKIAVSEDRNKKPHYQMIVEELGYLPTEVIVCGDRIPNDLAPARELGFKTVQMQWGRGMHYSGFKGDVDYSISQLKEIKTIVNDLRSL